jgi:hypothetical protein
MFALLESCVAPTLAATNGFAQLTLSSKKGFVAEISVSNSDAHIVLGKNGSLS